MVRLDFDVADEVMQDARQSPEEFLRSLRLAAAAYWYGRAEVTAMTAAQIAGLDLRGFFDALSAEKQSILNWGEAELELELQSVRAITHRDASHESQA